MTALAEHPTGQQPSDALPPEDLIPEAHRRHRQRLRWTGVSTLAIVVALVAGLLVALGGGATNLPPLPTTGPQFAAIVDRATAAGEAADIRVSVVTKTTPALVLSQRCGSSVTASAGTIDLRNRTEQLQVVSSASSDASCMTSPVGVQMRQFGSVVYETSAGSCLPTAPCPVGNPRLGPLRQLSFPVALLTQPVPVPIQILQTPFLLTMLQAIHGRLHPAGTMTVRGEPTRQYATKVTLAALKEVAGRVTGPGHQSVAAAVAIQRPNGPVMVPSASRILLPVGI